MKETGLQNDTTTTRARPKRDAAATREKLLESGLVEFCEKGFSGARTEIIVKRADCNIRMLYHYFGNKDGLYIAALERVYKEIRDREEKLNLKDMDPIEGISALVESTFSHMQENHDFVQLALIENIQQGRFLSKSNVNFKSTQSLVETISDLLKRGHDQGLFRDNVDPIQLYISIMSLSYTHISNKHTLSITFGQDLGKAEWIEQRSQHTKEMILGYLRP